MAKFSKNLIFIFLAISLLAAFHFSQAQTEGTVYVCPQATSLGEINPRCPGKIILKLGETINGMTLATTIYEDREYYVILGFINGGAAANLPPVADVNGPYQDYGGLPITLDASNSLDPNNDPLQYRWDFDNDEIWDTNWLSIPTRDYIWNNDYEGVVKLEISDGQFTAIDTTSVTVKSARTFKEETIDKLTSAKTGDKKINSKIEQIIKHIQNSLDNELWIDASHLVFFKKDLCIYPTEGIFKFDPDKINLEETFELEPEKMELKIKDTLKDKCLAPKIGLRVFYEEYIATKLMMKEFNGKPQIPEELNGVFKEIITKLVSADQLLTKISLYEAENTPIQNPKFKKVVEKQIEMAEKEIIKAEKELEKDRPDKAIMRFGKAWLYAQLAIKFANFKE